MANSIKTYNGMIASSFHRACLILTNEGLRYLFTRATSIPNRFFKVYIAFRDHDNGVIISYDNIDNQYSLLSMFDAINDSVSQEHRIPIAWDDNIENVFTVRVQEDIVLTPYQCVLSRPYRINYNFNTKPDSFYILVAFQESEWIFQRVPQNLIKYFTNELNQKIQSLMTQASFAGLISEIIESHINLTSIIRSVCESELRDLFGKRKSIREDELFDFVCNLACKPYEGTQNHGVIKFASDSAKSTGLIRFKQPVRCEIESTREIRKLLEMSDSDTPLIIRQNMVIGLGKEGTKNYSIVFEGNGKWKLYPDSKKIPICTVEGTVCIFPSPLGEDDFSSVFLFVFPEYETELGSIKEIIDKAKLQRHGTSIIICNEAEKEAQRLAEKSRAIIIDPISLIQHTNSIIKLTAIDGAMIISPDGFCYAIGAILDGEAVVDGDTARGARYNSLNNYVKWKKTKDSNCRVMAVVISEDQTTDNLPHMDDST